MLRSRSYLYVPLLHPASTPTYLPQARKLANSYFPTVYTPKDAFTSTHQLQEGDVVLFATDGIWDNLSASDILRGISVRMLAYHCWKEDGWKIAVSSEHLAATTRDASGTLHTRLAEGMVAMAKTRSYHGGKVDDITAVVTVVTKDSRNTSVPKTAAHR